jgi:hypothetical protein
MIDLTCALHVRKVLKMSPTLSSMIKVTGRTAALDSDLSGNVFEMSDLRDVAFDGPINGHIALRMSHDKQVCTATG